MTALSGFKWKGRHTVLLILYITWLVSYLDRMVISTAIPYIAKDFKLSPVAMGAVMSAFFVGYSAFQIPGGMLVDRLGARKIMLWGLGWWTTFTALTGAVNSLAPMIWVRALFGAGEGVGAASTYRVIANWFPPKERGTATAIMLSSNSFGSGTGSHYRCNTDYDVGLEICILCSIRSRVHRDGDDLVRAAGKSGE